MWIRAHYNLMAILLLGLIGMVFNHPAIAELRTPAAHTPAPEALSELSPLIAALDQDQVQVLIQWLKVGHSPESKIKNQMNEQLIDRAVMKGSSKCVAFLLKVMHAWKLKPKLVDSRGTPLIVSAAALAVPGKPKSKKFEKIVERLVRYFPETILQRDHAYIGDGRTVLHQSSAIGNLRLVRYLIRKKADVNVKSSTAETPLHFAARAGHLEVIRELISARADKDARALHTKATPLILASEMGHENAVRLLLSLKADRNIKDAFGKSPQDRYREFWLKSDITLKASTSVADESKKR